MARCAGAMEWGPRALGNRSILYRHDDVAVNDWLNKRLQRTEFMHEEPIVCTPQDALRAWRSADLDALVLGSFLLERQGTQPERSMA